MLPWEPVFRRGKRRAQRRACCAACGDTPSVDEDIIQVHLKAKNDKRGSQSKSQSGRVTTTKTLQTFHTACWNALTPDLKRHFGQPLHVDSGVGSFYFSSR